MRSWILAGLGLLALPSGVGAQAARHEMPAILLGNASEWFGPDQYPKDALAALRQGRVVADISVDLTGQATGCTIEVSSGTTSLDKATCEIGLAHASFNPATDRRGKPITSIYKLPVNWLLPEDDAPINAADAKLDTSGEVQIAVDEDGVGVSCRTISAVGHMPDPCANFRPGSKYGPGFVRDGRKVGAMVTRKWTVAFTINP